MERTGGRVSNVYERGLQNCTLAVLINIHSIYVSQVGLLQDLYPDLIERIGDAGNVATDKLAKSTVDVLALTGSLYVNGLTLGSL